MGKTRGNAIHIGVIAGVTMIVAGAGDADAAMISGGTDDFTLSDEGTDENVGDDTTAEPLEFDLFNSSLGTLTDVTFTLFESDKTFSQALDVDTSEPGEGDGTGELELDFTVFSDLAELTLFEQMDELTTFCNIDAGLFECKETSDSEGFVEFDGMFMVLGGDISNFSNGVGTFDIDVDFSGISSASANEGATAASVFNSVSWSGSLTVDYTYTPTPVPEPATLALFGTGLAGLVGLGYLGRRRRRK